jgi:hypothetical protein
MAGQAQYQKLDRVAWRHTLAFNSSGHPRYHLARVSALAVVRRLAAFVHTVVAQDGRNAQAVVLEYPSPPLRLGGAMLCKIAPVAHGLLVAEEG